MISHYIRYLMMSISFTVKKMTERAGLKGVYNLKLLLKEIFDTDVIRVILGCLDNTPRPR